MTLSLMTLSIMSFGVVDLFVTLSINNIFITTLSINVECECATKLIYQNNTQHKH